LTMLLKRHLWAAVTIAAMIGKGGLRDETYRIAFLSVLSILTLNCSAMAQSIDEEWGKVKVPSMPALENVRIEPAAYEPAMLGVRIC